jgi:hypothetical protein
VALAVGASVADRRDDLQRQARAPQPPSPSQLCPRPAAFKPTASVPATVMAAMGPRVTTACSQLFGSYLKHFGRCLNAV